MLRLILVGLFLISSLAPVYATEQWLVARPASADNPVNFPADSLANNDSLDRLLANHRQGMTLLYSTTTALSVAAGSIVCVDAASRHWFRQNTGATTINAANLDVGVAFANSTKYYVYANCSADATTATFTISTNTTTPTGPTAYRSIGTFTTDGSANVLAGTINQEPGGYVTADASGNKMVQGIFDYGTSSSAFSVQSGNLKVAYGSVSVGAASSASITNLPFTSSTSYHCVVSLTGNTTQTENNGCQPTSGSAMSVYNVWPSGSSTLQWIAIGT